MSRLESQHTDICHETHLQPFDNGCRYLVQTGHLSCLIQSPS
jgi:hypothetical protein